MPTLAQTFEQCARDLQAGHPDLVLSLLKTLDRAALAPASGRLHDHLQHRAQSLAATLGVAGEGTGGVPLLTLDVQEPLAGVSIVSACMNRTDNLLKVLPSWLASGADEIVIVDWSCTEPMAPLLAAFDDPRLKVVRIDGEQRWILTHAFNVGLRLARFETVFKLDADISITPGFLAANRVGVGEFVRGFWKQAVDAGEPDQRYTNGSFGARKADLRRAGYYDERILTYGWDDSELYGRLHAACGLAGRLLDQASLRHLAQEEAQRLENQSVAPAMVLGRIAPTEHENLVNRYQQVMGLEWAPYWPQQDYALTFHKPGRMHGRRTTALPQPPVLERRLARVLAMRQIITWVGQLPGLDADTTASLPLASLFEQAHSVGQGTLLADALRQRRGIHFFSAGHAALQPAVEHTLRALRQHQPELKDVLFVLADDGTLPNAPGKSEYFRASYTVVQALVEATGAATRRDLRLLEPALVEANAGCMFWDIDIDALAVSALAHAEHITSRLAPRYQAPAQPAAATALVTSVYDEMNLLRLLEYLACMVLNLRAFQYQLLMYEARNGMLQLVAQSMCRLLGVVPSALVLLPFDRRPTFEELFSVQGLLPPGTLLAAGNADVAFDASLAELAKAARQDFVYVLSRWDMDDDGHGAHLIRLECGVPNTFSADAWIARTPFEPDFRLDYPIGSFHCDSFINNQLSLSKRYGWANPCLDVHVFHVHDTRFNSSAEKQARDRVHIEQRYGEERERTGGNDPIKGAPWSNLAHAHAACDPGFLLRWYPKALVLDMTRPGFDLACLVWLHLMQQLIAFDPQVVLVARLRADDSQGPAGQLLAHYKRHFATAQLIIETDDFESADRGHDPIVLLRSVDTAALLDALTDGGLDALQQRLRPLVFWPSAPEHAAIMQVRCDASANMDTAATCRLLDQFKRHVETEHAQLIAFLQTLDPWSPGYRLVLPHAHDLAQPQPPGPAVVGLQKPQVCFVTSMFRGGNLVPGYLENVFQAAQQAHGQVVLVDANGNDHDAPAVEEFFRRHPQARSVIQLVRPAADPGLYACWQLAIEHSDSPYITNANLDDRRSPAHTALLVQMLESRPDIAAACGAISAVRQRAEAGWFDLSPNDVWFEDLGAMDFGFDELFVRQTDGGVRSRNILHCMPVWRRELHLRHGFFDEDSYGTSADWAFWLKCARAGERFRLDPRAFGRYYLNDKSHNRRNDADGAKERRIIADLIGLQQLRVVKQ